MIYDTVVCITKRNINPPSVILSVSKYRLQLLVNECSLSNTKQMKRKSCCNSSGPAHNKAHSAEGSGPSQIATPRLLRSGRKGAITMALPALFVPPQQKPLVMVKSSSLSSSSASFSSSLSSSSSSSTDIGNPKANAHPLLLQTNQTSSCMSCLMDDDDDDDAYGSPRGGMPRQAFLQRALSMRELHDSEWLSSSLIDLVLGRFSARYPGVHFMAVDFTVLSLSDFAGKNLETARDIRGQTVDFARDARPIVMVIPCNNVHWNMLRIVRSKQEGPSLEIFEPMGLPSCRHGLSLRNVPKGVIAWLDACCPLATKASWLTVARSAITTPQQLNGVDCGVAALLYAEKAGLFHSAESIRIHTDQQTISKYRAVLQSFLKRIQTFNLA